MIGESIQELDKRFKDYQEHYQNLHKEMLRAKSFYDCNFELRVPKDCEPMRLPTGKTRVDTVVVEVVTNKPVVKRHRSGHTDQQKSYDDKVEAALQNFLLDSAEYAQTPLLHEAAKLQLLRGCSIIVGPFYSLNDERCYFEVYDPRNVFLAPGELPKQGFIQLDITVSEMEELAERHKRLNGFTRGNRGDTERVELIQWWYYDSKERRGRYAAWVKGNPGFVADPGPSGYPYLPLDIVYSGWGQRTAGAKPEEIAISLLHPGVQSLLVGESEQFTMQHGSASQAVWGRYKLPEGASWPEDFQISTEPNSVTKDWPQGLEPLDYIPLGPEVGRQFEQIQSMIDDALYSRIMQGQRQPGVGTATGLAILTGRSRKRFEPVVTLLQGGVSRLLLKVGKLLNILKELYGESFKLNWRGTDLETKFYGDDFTVEVELMAEDEDEKRMRQAEGMALWDKLPERYIAENYLGVENWSEQEEQRLYERIINSDQYMQIVLQLYTGMVTQQAEEKQAKESRDVSPDALQRLASIYREAKTGFAPTQPGTVEGIAQQIGETRRLPL